jgi:predicted ester cyclase
VGEAREVMDRLTEAFFNKDYETATKLYAPNAIVETPDAGELKGGAEVAQYMKVFFDAFPDAKYEASTAFESGNTAVDEGRFVGTNTGPLRMPNGEELPPTGKRVNMRGADIATIENGLVTSHRFYFDQMELMSQLGLAPE